MLIKAVIFDLGETLFSYGEMDVNARFHEGARLTYDYLNRQNSTSGKLPAFPRYFRRHYLSIKWHYAWSNVLRREFDCLALLDRKSRKMGFCLSDTQLEELAWLWYKPLGDTASIEPDLLRTLQTLTDMSLRLAIISNTFLPASSLDQHLQKFDLLKFFPVRVYSSDTVFRKPDKRIYQAALGKIGVSAAHVMMVGDKQREDIKGPARLGIRPVFKRGLLNQKTKVPVGVPVIENVSELPALIEKV